MTDISYLYCKYVNFICKLMFDYIIAITLKFNAFYSFLGYQLAGIYVIMYWGTNSLMIVTARSNILDDGWGIDIL